MSSPSLSQLSWPSCSAARCYFRPELKIMYNCCIFLMISLHLIIAILLCSSFSIVTPLTFFLMLRSQKLQPRQHNCAPFLASQDPINLNNNGRERLGLAVLRPVRCRRWKYTADHRRGRQSNTRLILFEILLLFGISCDSVVMLRSHTQI